MDKIKKLDKLQKQIKKMELQIQKKMNELDRNLRVILRSAMGFTLSHEVECDCVGCGDVYKRLALKDEDLEDIGAADSLIEWMSEKG